MTEPKDPLKVWGWQYSPYSTDPLDYDDVVHHVAWTSVFGTLVSSYKVGQIEAQIAESWKSSNDFREWTFKIKPKCYFENGDRVTPAIVASSLKRVAFLQHKKNSSSGFTEDLVDIENLKDLTSDFAGIKYDNEYVVLRFNEPKENLLLQIGFGLYSIIHPSQFDQNGVWNNKKSAISSGPYKIKNWNDDTLQLTLNEKQAGCFLLPAKPVKNIELSFGFKKIDLQTQDIISGSSKSLMIDDSFSFLGPADSDIMYIRLYKNLSLETSRLIRDAIISEMTKLPNILFSLNRSFLPLTIKGITQGQIDSIKGEDFEKLKGVTLKVPNYEHATKSTKMSNYLSYTESFNKIMDILGSKYQMNIIKSEMNYADFGNIEKRASLFDMEMLLTGVLIADPSADVEFMFKSKEGIQLPDKDGTIMPLLKEASRNLNEINQKIWDQAQIIPLTHYSSGLWVKKNAFDTQDLNHLLPATNFQFIGYK